MIKIYNRWEDEDWFLKSKLEPWICYVGDGGGGGGGGDWLQDIRDAQKKAAASSPAPSPSPAPAPSPSPAPAPAPSPTPSPTASPTASPTPSPAPAPELEVPEYSPTPEAEQTDEVDYASELVSGMPELGDPVDMPDPSQRTVDVQELVEYRMNQMMASDNALRQRALTQGQQLAADSGLLNTSIAASAGIDSLMKNLLPIAQQDAATLHGQALENQRAVNEFLMQEYLTQNQFILTEYGAQTNTYNQGLQQAYNANQAAIVRAWEEEQAKLDRELKIWGSQFEAESNMDLQNAADAAAGSRQGAGHGQASKGCIADATAKYNEALMYIVSSGMDQEQKSIAIATAQANYNRLKAAC